MSEVRAQWAIFSLWKKSYTILYEIALFSAKKNYVLFMRIWQAYKKNETTIASTFHYIKSKIKNLNKWKVPIISRATRDIWVGALKKSTLHLYRPPSEPCTVSKKMTNIRAFAHLTLAHLSFPNFYDFAKYYGEKKFTNCFYLAQWTYTFLLNI